MEREREREIETEIEIDMEAEMGMDMGMGMEMGMGMGMEMGTYSSDANQTVEKWPHPSFFSILYLSLRRSPTLTGW